MQYEALKYKKERCDIDHLLRKALSDGVIVNWEYEEINDHCDRQDIDKHINELKSTD